RRFRQAIQTRPIPSDGSRCNPSSSLPAQPHLQSCSCACAPYAASHSGTAASPAHNILAFSCFRVPRPAENLSSRAKRGTCFSLPPVTLFQLGLGFRSPPATRHSPLPLFPLPIQTLGGRSTASATSPQSPAACNPPRFPAPLECGSLAPAFTV